MPTTISAREYWNKTIGPHAAYELGVSMLGGKMDARTVELMGPPPSGYAAWKASHSAPFKAPVADNDDALVVRPVYTPVRASSFRVAATEASSRSFSLTAIIRALADYVALSVLHPVKQAPAPQPRPQAFRPYLAAVNGALTPAARANALRFG